MKTSIKETLRALTFLFCILLSVQTVHADELRILDSLGLVRFVGEVSGDAQVEVTVSGEIKSGCEIVVSDLSGFAPEKRVAIKSNKIQLKLTAGNWKINSLCRQVAIKELEVKAR